MIDQELLTLRSLERADIRTWSENSKAEANFARLLICASGYEERSSYFAREIERLGIRNRVDKCIALEISEFPNLYHKTVNRMFYQAFGAEILSITSYDSEFFEAQVINQVRDFLSSAMSKPVEIHIDYSSMPRSWYCRIPILLSNQLREGDHVYMWYTPGRYRQTEFQSGGIHNFINFSGRALISAQHRIHVLGLGFDAIRSQSVIAELDPQSIVCYYADPALDPKYVNQVQTLNADILNQAEAVFTVPLLDFPAAFGAIRDIVSQYLRIGNVIIVPDGPKPIILASSLVPLTFEHSLNPQALDDFGAVCFHVGRRRGIDYTPSDVSALAEPLGFFYCA